LLDSEVDSHIRRIETPFGDGPHQRQSELSREWLLGHEQAAYPRLLARAAEAGSPATYAMLAEFGRPPAIPLLAQALDAGGPHADAAARALARHPQAAAGKALRAALARPDPAISIAAADGLLLRADRRDCPALRAQLAAPDALVRYHVLQAAGGLGCIRPEALELFAERDASEDIRSLAAALRDASPDPRTCEPDQTPQPRSPAGRSTRERGGAGC